MCAIKLSYFLPIPYIESHRYIYEPNWHHFVVSLTKVTSSIPNAWRSLQKVCAEGGWASPPLSRIRSDPSAENRLPRIFFTVAFSKFFEQNHFTYVCAGSKVLIAWFGNLWAHVWITRAKIIYFKWLVLRLIKEEFPFYIFPILFDYIFSRSCLITYFPDPVWLHIFPILFDYIFSRSCFFNPISV